MTATRRQGSQQRRASGPERMFAGSLAEAAWEHGGQRRHGRGLYVWEVVREGRICLYCVLSHVVVCVNDVWRRTVPAHGSAIIAAKTGETYFIGSTKPRSHRTHGYIIGVLLRGATTNKRAIPARRTGAGQQGQSKYVRPKKWTSISDMGRLISVGLGNHTVSPTRYVHEYKRPIR